MIIVFIIAFILFYNFHFSCYYKEKYNVICSTCGITRDFKSLLAFEDENLINPLSKKYFTFLLSFFLMRFIASFLTLRNVKYTLTFLVWIDLCIWSVCSHTLVILSSHSNYIGCVWTYILNNKICNICFCGLRCLEWLGFSIFLPILYDVPKIRTIPFLTI